MSEELQAPQQPALPRAEDFNISGEDVARIELERKSAVKLKAKLKSWLVPFSPFVIWLLFITIASKILPDSGCSAFVLLGSVVIMFWFTIRLDRKGKQAQIIGPLKERYNEYVKSVSDYRDKERSYIRDLDRYERELKRLQGEKEAEARK